MLVSKKDNMPKSHGFTLIELMIAMLIGMLVVAAAIAMYVTAIKGSSNTLKSAQLNEELSFVATLMTNDIRRAGYWGGAVTGSDARNNIFNGLNILNSQNCILYTYDVDADATLDADEYFGFRLNNGSVQIKSGGANTVTDCSVGIWNDVLDDDFLEVTALTFCLANTQWKNVTQDTNGVAADCSNVTPTATTGDDIVEVRQIDINMAARVKSDTDIQTQLSQAVRVRNNRAYTVP